MCRCVSHCGANFQHFAILARDANADAYDDILDNVLISELLMTGDGRGHRSACRE